MIHTSCATGDWQLEGGGQRNQSQSQGNLQCNRQYGQRQSSIISHCQGL
jgi:hypothetical protein